MLFWYEIPVLMLQKILQDVFLFGVLVSGWVRRWMGRIVAVGIVILVMIVLLSCGEAPKMV